MDISGFSCRDGKTLTYNGSGGAEDVLRAFVLSGFFGAEPDSSVSHLMSTWRSRAQFSKDQLWSAFWEWATYSTIPSCGINLLVKTNWISYFPGLGEASKSSYRNSKQTVLQHCAETCDRVGQVAGRNVVRLAALCHDMPRFMSFLRFIGAPEPVRQQVMRLVVHHEVSLGGEISEHEIRYPVALARIGRTSEVKPPHDPDIILLGKFLLPNSIDQLAEVIEADHRPQDAHLLRELAGRYNLLRGLPQPVVTQELLQKWASLEKIPRVVANDPEISQALCDFAYYYQMAGDFSSEDDAEWTVKELLTGTIDNLDTLSYLKQLSDEKLERLEKGILAQGMQPWQLFRLTVARLVDILGS